MTETDVKTTGLNFQNYVATGRDTFFSEMLASHEKLQPVPDGASYEWTETSMFGFNIPEHAIDAIIYYWHHPVLKVCYGGIMIWRGHTENQVGCDYSDYRSAMPMPTDITDCTYSNGVTVKMIEPMREFEIAFDDPEYDTSLRLHLSAIMPPACRYNGGHLTQAMRTRGELKLLGERFKINGFHSRDRSWNEARSEKIRRIPPLNWTVGIADESFAFHHCSFDNPDHHPEWRGVFDAVNRDNNCLWGYVFADGALHGVVRAEQRTWSRPDGITPDRIESILTVASGKTYSISGRSLSSAHIQCWPNMGGCFSLFEWDCDGRLAYGDVQTIFYRDAYRLVSNFTVERPVCSSPKLTLNGF